MNFLFPIIAYAQEDFGITELVLNINKFVLNPIIAFIFALALLYFFFGLAKFLANKDNEEKLGDGKRHMMWGVIGMVIMVSVFGIMNIIIQSTGSQSRTVDPETLIVNLG